MWLSNLSVKTKSELGRLVHTELKTMGPKELPCDLAVTTLHGCNQKQEKIFEQRHELIHSYICQSPQVRLKRRALMFHGVCVLHFNRHSLCDILCLFGGACTCVWQPLCPRSFPSGQKHLNLECFYNQIKSNYTNFHDQSRVCLIF